MENLILENIDTTKDKDWIALWLSYQPNYVIYQEEGATEQNIREAVKEYLTMLPRMLLLEGYYKGVHNVLRRIRFSQFDNAINYRLVFPEPNYIVNTLVGFGYGKGATYKLNESVKEPKAQNALDKILTMFRKQNVQSQTATIARYVSIYGRALEKTYINRNAEPATVAIRPTSGFVVYNNEIEQVPMYAVEFKRIDGKEPHYEIAVYDEEYVTTYKSKDMKLEALDMTAEPQEHFIGQIPIAECWNNEDLQGDFETSISLIDSKNEIGSDHINGIRQFIENLLVFYGISTGNDEEEKALAHTKMKQLRELTVKGDGTVANPRVEYVTSQVDHLGMNDTLKRLTDDIAKYSFVPNFTDESFAGIASGVAMAFKLIGIESKLDVKNPFMVSLLRERLQKYENVLAVQGADLLDIRDVDITFSTKRPNIDIETATIIPSALSVGVKPEVLAMQFSFVNSEEQIEVPDETNEEELNQLFAQAEETVAEETISEPTEEVEEMPEDIFEE
jgi:SPP1 family phage portal protein